MAKKTIRVSKNVFWMGLTSLFTDISSEMIYPILPIFLTTTLGVNKAFIGIIEGVAESTASILKVFSGWFSDKVKKRKPPVVWGYCLSTIGKPLLALSTNGFHALFIRFLDRVGKGVRTSPRDALIAESAAKKDTGRAFGFHRAMDTLGAVIGPLLAFLILPFFQDNLRPVFLIAFIPGFIAVILLMLFVTERKDNGKKGGKPVKFTIKHFSLKLKFFILIVFLFNLGNSSNAFLILRAQDLGVALVLMPILWLMFNSVYTALSYPSGVLSDKIGRKRILLVGYAIYSLAYFGFALAKTPLHIWLLFASYGIYYGLCDGVERAFVADLSPKQFKGTAFGVYNAAVGFALLPASVIAGSLWQAIGPQATFSFGGVLAGVAALLLLFI